MMKKMLLFTSLLLVVLLTANRSGYAQAAFNTGETLFKIDYYGGMSIYTFSANDTLYQIDRASILVAGNPDQVLDYWNDVGFRTPTTLVGNPENSDYEVTGSYDNSYSGLPPKVIVDQTVYGWNNKNCALIKFVVTNNDSSDLPTIVGLDINQELNNDWENDTVFYNQNNNILYNYDSLYVGFKILSGPTAAVAYFQWYLEYTENDTAYYNWLTGGINTATLVSNPNGAVGILGTDSTLLLPQGKRTVYMAVALGTDEASMLANMAFAESKYGTITAVEEPIAVSETYKLSQNYPNPFNPSTTISFTIPERERVVIEIYDLLGQRVASILNKEMEAGSHEISFNASDLSAGIYFYTLRAGSFSSTKKMMLLK